MLDRMNKLNDEYKEALALAEATPDDHPESHARWQRATNILTELQWKEDRWDEHQNGPNARGLRR